VDRLLASMGSRQLAGWIAYFQVEAEDAEEEAEERELEASSAAQASRARRAAAERRR
jgi:hypothetical protein